MTTITNILIKGLVTKGNSFKITLNDLINQSNMSKDDVCIALNSITQWDAWEMIILN